MKTPDSGSMETKNDSGVAKRRLFPFLVPPKKYSWVLAVFIVAGVLGGYAYYALIGCRSGGCAITSNPYMSMAWGGIMGYLLPDFFVKKSDSKQETSEDK